MDVVRTEPECRGTHVSPRFMVVASNSTLVGVIAAYLATDSIVLAIIAATTALVMVGLLIRHQRGSHVRV